MTKTKYALILLLILTVSLLLTGCWDRREIEERTIVLAIGLDVVEDKPDMLSISVQIPVPLKISNSGGGAGGGDGAEAVIVMETQSRTVLEGIQVLQNRLNQRIFFGQTRVLAFGEKLARKGLRTITDSFRRDPEIRRLLWPIVVKGKASDLLRSKPSLEQIPSVFLMSMFDNGTKMGMIPDMNLGHFFVDLSTTGREPYLNYLQINGHELIWSGVALLRGDRMVGTLTPEETWQLLRIDDEKDGGDLVFPFEGSGDRLITLSTELIKSRKTFAHLQDRLKVHYEVHMEGNLLEKTFGQNLFDERDIRLIESGANEFLEANAKQMIEKLQKYNTDAMGIGTELRAFHPKIWKKLHWPDAFAEAEITVSFHFELRNTGNEIE
ncbi:hypothetical protein PA598K_02517 [Paenibacillus sp. 598K]|uniref:Ger(x)C family spore germination protein n=1 Tax=Paenibacillus sp. 598K TaxID=1117987 RepID=UPI000FFA61D6|nr:Ger(x)C family spore germination protein [Paenibacillus sp. 598K]GBF74185.1 hypothetical protein PA598K_02517 [Paenibacillus sp. 598K]